ncbi:phage head closure protein [Bacillus sp. 3103sda1]|uniref:phage head closure protein n=1 Tax=Bacillus sp. 3103sda1 TaxID=2953808 RepID=UPI0020A0DE2A|nr:phage head closure protein [Bacillus sp. 3103sda1]MCP1124565.1 phage head closure protein [Bacillus sp. 3103sda1]
MKPFKYKQSLSAAKLNKRITFQSRESVQDAEGNWTEGEWKDDFTVWGSIVGAGSMRSPEVTVAGALGVKSPKRITIRVNKNLKHNMRATYKGRLFDVLDFDFAKDSDLYYEIICNEVGING